MPSCVLGSEPGGEAFRGALLSSDERPELTLVLAIGDGMVAIGFLQLSGQNISGRHGERSSFAGKERGTERGVPSQGDPAARPSLGPDLAHEIQVKVIGRVERRHDVPAFPSHIGERLSQQPLLISRTKLGLGEFRVRSANKEEDRSIVAQCVTCDLPAWHGVADIGGLVAFWIARDAERSRIVAEISFQ